MPTAETMRELVQQVVAMLATEREKAIALHDHVRDSVKFGFTRYCDAARPDYTLARGVGHCNPKSRLMVAFFREIGLAAHQHFVVIPSDILKGALPRRLGWLLPRELSHSYVDVRVDGTWCAIDSFIVDTALLHAAQARLAKEGRTLGYGVRADSTNVWDGHGDAFSQFDRNLLIEDHGRVEDLEAYFRDQNYRNKRFGIPLNTLFRIRSGGPVNSHLERIRTSLLH
jgi:hypothetical protein